jgi:ribosomal protein S18 acetylase RimI-like enzyme
LNIKRLHASDAEQYWNLRLEALKQNPEAFATSYEEAIQRKNPIERVAGNLEQEENYTFGAFDQEELVGMVTVLQEQNEKMQHRANIFAMYVTPKMRGEGVGKALLNEVVNQARTIEGIEKLNLSVVASNEKAKRLYSGMGFKVFGFEEKAMKVNDAFYDEEHMVLFL